MLEPKEGYIFKHLSENQSETSEHVSMPRSKYESAKTLFLILNVVAAIVVLIKYW